MLAYKLCRIKKNGAITPLHIDKTRELVFDEWLPSEMHITSGFAIRQGWHCAPDPYVPHMEMETKTDKRVWVEVFIDDFTPKVVPKSQGGMWYLAQRIIFRRILDDLEVQFLLDQSNWYTNERQLMDEDDAQYA